MRTGCKGSPQSPGTESYPGAEPVHVAESKFRSELVEAEGAGFAAIAEVLSLEEKFVPKLGHTGCPGPLLESTPFLIELQLLA